MIFNNASFNSFNIIVIQINIIVPSFPDPSVKILFDFYDVEQIYQKPEQELGIHQQQEGTILGMCITGTASKDSLATWIKHLEKSNPVLSQIPVVFSLRTPEAGIVAIRDTDDMKPELAVPEQN